MELYKKYRPSTFDEMIGNESVINNLKSLIKSKKNHVFLFTGDSGVGKTTAARICAKELGANELSIIEINSGNNRGIDTARQIIEQMKNYPIYGKAWIYIIDECFSGDTIIKGVNNDLFIKDVRKGDLLYNASGIDKVKNIFKNKIRLDRIIKLDLSNKKTIFCSKEHLFYTNKGWIPAYKLEKKHLILPFSCDIMNNIIEKEREINCEKSTKNKSKMFRVWRDFFNYCKTKKKILFPKMFAFSCWKKITNSYKEIMRVLWKNNDSTSKGQIYKKILFPNLCWEISPETSTYNRDESFHRKINYEQDCYEKIQEKPSRKSEGNRFNAFRKDEKKQSFLGQKNYRKNNDYKKEKRHITCMEREKGREWKFDRSSNTIRFLLERLYNGVCYFIRKKTKRISDLLQSRFRKSKNKISYRDRWKWASIEKKYKKGFEKRKEIEGIRVESIEIYKRGSNDKHFSSIISDKERKQGYVEFYDLEMDRHPSYFANNCLVHNCHKATSEWANAMLKPLEDTPSHVYFFLCTTNPEKLLKPLKNRCQMVKFPVLSNKDLTRLLRRINRKEEGKANNEVIDKIISLSYGSARRVLVLLEKIINEESEQALKILKNDIESDKKEIIDLCRCLINNKNSWQDITDILNKLKDEDLEKIRRAILGYMNKILLSGKQNDKAAIILEAFQEPFYNVGFPGLTLACYQSLFSN